MKLASALLAALFLCALSAKTQTQCPLGLSGTFTVGPTGNYSTLTAALADLQAKGVTGPTTLELQSGYTCTAETFPITMGAVPCASQTNKITIRPAAGAPTLLITSNDSIATLDLNNGSFYTLEGRPGGTDTAHQLTIVNTHTAGTAIRLVNGASYNELNHLTAEGVNTVTNGGVITLAGTDTVNNIYNRIDSCTVTAGATQPIYGILATDYHPNKHNVINGCNVSNVGGNFLYGATGIRVETGYDSITVTNNSVYQTAAYNIPYNHYVDPWAYIGLLVGGAADGGDLIENNYVGGSQPKAGGAPMQLNDCSLFIGITASSYTGAGYASKVIGNTITNISFVGPNGASAYMIDLGLSNHGMFDGAFNGICADNTIGNMGPGYSIQSPYQSDLVQYPNLNLQAIALEPSSYTDPIHITGNRIGGWQSDARVGSGGFIGINASNDVSPYAVLTIDSNYIGDDSTPNSIQIPNPYSSAKGIWVFDPSCECTPVHDSIIMTNNHISNITSSTTTGISYFIQTTSLVSQEAQGRIVSNNTLTNLSGSEITGIYLYNPNSAFVANGTGNVLCTGNTLLGLGSLSNGYGTSIIGIDFISTGFANTMHCSISGNRLFSFYGSSITGITAGGEYIDVSTIDNNMIDLGLSPSGHPFDYAYSNSQGITGISGGKGFNVLHNSIYVHVPGNAPSANGISGAGIAEGDSSGITGLVMNNIISAYYPTRDVDFALLSLVQHVPSDYNIFNVQGQGYIGWQYHTTGIFQDSTLAGWQNRSGGDQHSQFADPLFNNTEAAAPYIDLHLQQGTPAESAGTPAYTTLTDIDSKIRAQWTPVDIGAAAGNFKLTTTPPDTSKNDTTATPPTPTDSAIVVPYPNPFSGTLTLNLLANAPGTAHVLVYSLTGKLVVSLHPNVVAGSNIITIPTDAFPDGVYILHVYINNQRQTLEIQKRSN